MILSRPVVARAANGLGEVPLRLVLNRHARGWRAAARRREVERVLGRPFDFVIGEDARAFGETFNRGVPLAKVARWSRANREVKRLADGIAMALARTEAKPSAAQRSGARLALGGVG